MPKMILRNLKPKKPAERKVAPKIKRQVITSKVLIDKKVALLKIKNKMTPFVKEYPGMKKGFEMVSTVILNAEKEISQLRSAAKNNSDAHALIDHLNGRKERFFGQINGFVNSSKVYPVNFIELEILAKGFVDEATGIRNSLYPKQTPKPTGGSGKGDYNAKIHGSK